MAPPFGSCSALLGRAGERTPLFLSKLPFRDAKYEGHSPIVNNNSADVVYPLLMKLLLSSSSLTTSDVGLVAIIWKMQRPNFQIQTLMLALWCFAMLKTLHSV